MRQIPLLGTALFILFSTSAQSTDTLWYLNGTSQGWYESPQVACEHHYLFSSFANYTNPTASPIGPSGNPSSTGAEFCYGIPPDRDTTYVGPIHPSECAAFNPAHPRYFLCLEEPDEPDKDDGSGCIGNPCNPATGNKYQPETDFSGNGLTFTRSYNSRNLAELGFGKGWRSNHQKKLLVATNSLTQVSGTGQGEPWTKTAGVWQGDADSDVLITENAAGFQLLRANGVIEHYSLTGQLLSEIAPNGHQTTYSYNADQQLTQVTDHYGHSISFTYAAEQVANVTDALGAVYRYAYDSNNNLVTVIYPDTTPEDDTDNPRKTYHYENNAYPNHLTGITDANGDRYATYAYDSEGKAVSTEHSQTTNSVGQEKFELDYQVEVTP